jgi:hypothetical protein
MSKRERRDYIGCGWLVRTAHLPRAAPSRRLRPAPKLGPFLFGKRPTEAVCKEVLFESSSPRLGSISTYSPPNRRRLLRRVKPAVLPARCRFHGVFDYRFMDMIALRAFEGPHIGPGRTRFNTGQHHASALTLWAAGAFNREKRRYWPHMRLGHVMHPSIRQRNSLSSPVTAIRMRRCSKSCTPRFRPLSKTEHFEKFFTNN